MAPCQRMSNVNKSGRQVKSCIKIGPQPLTLKAQEGRKRPQRANKGKPQGPIGWSARLGESQRKPISNDRNAKPEHSYPSSNSDIPGTRRDPTAPLQAKDRKRIRSREPEDPLLLPANEVIGPKKYFRQAGQQGISVCKGRSRHLLFTASNRNLARSPAPPHLVIKRQGPKKVLFYGNPLYQTILESKGSLMKEARGGITDESSTLIESSLAMAPTVPENSLFRDDLSDTTCEKVQRGNEARVIRDIELMVVPSAAILDTYGATLPECLVERFRRSAFTDDQLEKLKPFIGGRVALDIADRQNAYSMTLAVRGVELFKLVKCEKDIERDILAFSISHDHTPVMI
ncbi:hypothetical protein PABG_04203 [Paracoccidioides brasiliensis Pb03]|nr:hypothetical protein PABG_04203 [Paracoccidioides brasiliensis Pb03]